MDAADFEERTKLVVTSLLAKIDTKDKEIAQLTVSLDNLRHLVLEHQEEGETLYGKLQSQEKTILALLQKVKTATISQSSISSPASEAELAELKDALAQKDAEIEAIKREFTFPPPPVLFMRPPRTRALSVAASATQSGNFLDSIMDELMGNDEAEVMHKKISDQHSQIMQLEAAVDIAEVELRHWRKFGRKFLAEDAADISDHD